MDFGNVSGVITALLLISFLAGVAWAWSAKRKPQFDAAARIPLDDNEVKP
jgi:cytochrome c oxidase cbb3-type subunit 4